MAHHLVKRFSQGERLFHWVHMLSFILLLMTGLGLYAKSFFGLTELFGGVGVSRTIHHYVGLVFIVTTFIIFIQWFKDITAPGEDSLGDVIKSYLDHSVHAKSGKINAGQKLLGWCAFIFGVIMGVSGLAMWFPFQLGRGMQQWMYFLHNFVFILLMLMMIVHIYLGTAGNPGTWRTMSRGTVSREWAKKHHPNWDAEEA
jgi:formate dehydrogenase subunit gamma